MGIIIGNLSLSISNLFLGIAFILGWLVLMVGIPPSNSHQFRIATFFISISLLPVSWWIYITSN